MRLLLPLLALLLLGSCAGPRTMLAPAGGRLVARLSLDAWSNEGELRSLVQGAAEAGFDSIAFEARRDGSVAYPSRREPWAAHLGGDPGWDPLAAALDEARTQGLAFLVEVELVPVWSGAAPPTDPEHPWRRYPAWRWVDANGEEQSLRPGARLSFDPCLPEVRAYLADVATEPARRYPVDGLVLTGARFLNDHPSVPFGRLGDPPRGPRTMELYRAETGIGPDDDPDAFASWRARQLTALVRDVRARLAASERPELLVTVLPNDGQASVQHQDWTTWLREGLVDGVAPLDEDARATLLRSRNERWASRVAEGTQVLPRLRIEAVGPDDNFRVRVEAAREATRSAIVVGAEPWLATELTDLSAGAEAEALGGGRSQLRRALR